MISKRVEEGRDLDLRSLFSAICAQVERMRSDPEFRR
jgi:hypothetical protein